MEILFVAGTYYEDKKGEVLNLRVKLTENETVAVGDIIGIEMTDDTILKRDVRIINPRFVGDYKYVSKKIAAEVEAGEYSASEERTMFISGPCTAWLVVMNVPYHEVMTSDRKASRDRMRNMVCISPFKEIHCGEKSIYDFVREEYSVPDKVIGYLCTKERYTTSPGTYEHPFKPGMELKGPHMYTDGHYYWDRDTWKYVVKYHVVLPQEFIDHVMSEEGTAFIENCIERCNAGFCSDAVIKWKKKKGFAYFLPDNYEAAELNDF